MKYLPVNSPKNIRPRVEFYSSDQLTMHSSHAFLIAPFPTRYSEQVVHHGRFSSKNNDAPLPEIEFFLPLRA